MTKSRGEPSSSQKVQEATRALSALRDSLTALSIPYVLQGTAAASDKATLIRDQLGDYILPRLASLDAPLLAVVGGSTGAGKSTLVSSLVRRHVARASAIRPTTRRPPAAARADRRGLVRQRPGPGLTVAPARGPGRSGESAHRPHAQRARATRLRGPARGAGDRGRP